MDVSRNVIVTWSIVVALDYMRDGSGTDSTYRLIVLFCTLDMCRNRGSKVAQLGCVSGHIDIDPLHARKKKAMREKTAGERKQKGRVKGIEKRDLLVVCRGFITG